MVDIERVEKEVAVKMTVTSLPAPIKTKLERTYGEPFIANWLKGHPDAPKVRCARWCFRDIKKGLGSHLSP
jgi:hypothetical protein